MRTITKEEFRRMRAGAIIEVSDDSNIWELVMFKGHDDKDSCDRPHGYPTCTSSSGEQCFIDARWPEGVDKEHFMNRKPKTWIDPETSLEWDYDKGKEMTWDEAMEYANSIGDGWRLPTLRELDSLVDRDIYDPACSKSIEIATASYWSSADYKPGGKNAWYVNFYSGLIDAALKNSARYVRCVR